MILQKMSLTNSRVAGLIALLMYASTAADTAARADDGGISFGGSPHILGGHPSVSMKSEEVKIVVGKDLIKVDCNFVFHNDGPASLVRVGFPDQGLGAEEPYQGEELPKKNLHASFLSYESYVYGKKVDTKLIPTNDRELFWHTKNVNFKAHSDCIIRDVYTLKPGGQVTNENGLYHQTYYVLHTGSSWHGPIGNAVVSITFEPGAAPEPIHLKALKSLSLPDPKELKWSKLPVGTVLYEGPGEPTFKGRTITFTRSNFRPTVKEDIHLFYDYKKLTNMP